MKDFAERLWHMVTVLIGFAVFFGIMFWAARIRSSRWRSVAAVYGGTGRGKPLGSLRLETLAFADPGSFSPIYGGKFDNRYMSVRVIIFADGLQMDAIFPFNILRPPLFLPFADMAPLQSEDGTFATFYALRMRRLKDTDLIVRKQVVDFVRERSEVPPFGLGI